MADLKKLARTADRDQTRADESRRALHVAILDALNAGQTQAQIARDVGRTRETIRKIALAARR